MKDISNLPASRDVDQAKALESPEGYGAYDWLDELADASCYSGTAQQAWANEIRSALATVRQETKAELDAIEEAHAALARDYNRAIVEVQAYGELVQKLWVIAGKFPVGQGALVNQVRDPIHLFTVSRVPPAPVARRHEDQETE